MRRLLAIFFLIMFSLQVVPVKELGKLLSKSQNTEEVQGDDDVSSNDALNAGVVCYSDMILSRYSFDPVACSNYIKDRLSLIIRDASLLPLTHVPAVPAPPPDFI